MLASLHKVLRFSLAGAILMGMAAAPPVSTDPSPETLSHAGGPTPSLQAVAWLSPNWRYRVPMVARYDQLEAGAVLLRFPLLMDGAVAPALLTKAKPDGSDIVITKGDGTTLLSHEVVRFDPGNSTAEIWFKADTLSATARSFYVYYGNVDTTIAPSGSVWNSDYRGVYHFEENPGAGTLRDYTAAEHHAFSNQPNANWTSSDVTSGQIGQAWLFNGTSHYINTNLLSTKDGSYTISCWLKHTSRTTDFAIQASPGYWHISSQTSEVSNMPQFRDALVDVRFEPGQIPINAYHYYAWVFHESPHTIDFYLDGVLQDLIGILPRETDPDSFYVGRAINPDSTLGNERVGIIGPMYYNGQDHMDGGGDEFRISDADHSQVWVTAEFNNQKNPSAFYSVGAEETYDPSPVTLQSFEVTRSARGADLRWSVSNVSPDHLGFHVYRQAAGETRTRISDELLTGSRTYTFVDADPPPGHAFYWLAEVSLDGTVSWYGPASLDPLAASDLKLHQNSPNPFARITTVTFTLPAADRVVLRIFDLRGRQVRYLLDRPLPAGPHAITWDRKTDSGAQVSPGVYFYRLESSRGSIARKLVVM